MTEKKPRRTELRDDDHKDYHGGYDLIREAKHRSERQWLEALARVARRWVPGARYICGRGWIDGDGENSGGGRFLMEDLLDGTEEPIEYPEELEFDVSMFLDALAGLWPGEADYLGDEIRIDLGETA